MSGGDDSSERELKFANVEHSVLRERLIELAAEKEASGTLEKNWIFDRGGELNESGRVLRLRVDRRGTHLTYKGPAAFDGKVKVREEHETTVGDAKKMRALLEALGFEAVHRYQKIREEWRLGSIIIALDHTPIGDFAEFEGPDCERVARRCGFDSDTAERRSYLRLYADHREANPDAPPFMEFPDSAVR